MWFAIGRVPLGRKLRGRPDEAVALTGKRGSPYVLSANAPNVTVWPAFAMVKVCGTFAAAR